MKASVLFGKSFWCACVVLVVCSMVRPCGGRSASERVSAPAAERYHAAMLRCVAGLAADMEKITASASAAAEKFVRENYRLRASSGGLEFLGRSGGMFAFGGQDRIRETDVVMYWLHAEPFDSQIAEISSARRKGAMIIIFAGGRELDRAAKAGVDVTQAVDNHASAGDAVVVGARGGPGVSTLRAANNAAGWVWTAEFVAACTRLGKMPTMWRAFAVPEGHAWADRIGRTGRYRRARFHREAPPRIAPGRLGREYLRELQKALKAVRRDEMGDIRATAVLAVQATAAGHKAYIYPLSHTTHDVERFGCFTRISKGWGGLKDGKRLARGDFVFVLEYDGVIAPSLHENGHSLDRGFAGVARRAGARLAWSFSTYRRENVAAVAPDEILIGQHWAFGDAAVSVPGYPFKGFPISGVIFEAILGMVTAEVYDIPREGD